MQDEQSEWYNAWFDSPFYHILYKNHDFHEAEVFIDNLATHLHLQHGATIADVACGRGRHSVYLNQKGYHVTGLDLSAKNIEFASKFANQNLHFNIHDMRNPFGESLFDYVFNMFTSFGYFEDENDNIRTLQAFKKACKGSGSIIIDFMNTPKVLRTLIAGQVKTVDDISFHIKKHVLPPYILKEISFSYKLKKYQFEEKVRLIYFQDFMKYFLEAGLRLVDVYGSYQLEPYDEENSDRMIFILKHQS